MRDGVVNAGAPVCECFGEPARDDACRPEEIGDGQLASVVTLHFAVEPGQRCRRRLVLIRVFLFGFDRCCGDQRLRGDVESCKFTVDDRLRVEGERVDAVVVVLARLFALFDPRGVVEFGFTEGQDAGARRGGAPTEISSELGPPFMTAMGEELASVFGEDLDPRGQFGRLVIGDGAIGDVSSSEVEANKLDHAGARMRLLVEQMHPDPFAPGFVQHVGEVGFRLESHFGDGAAFGSAFAFADRAAARRY